MSEADFTSITPEQASRGATDNLPDRALPMLAATWLAEGMDSAELREFTGRSAGQAAEARRLWPEVLASLGYPAIHADIPRDESPWRGYWGEIEWGRRVMDEVLSPYATAQRVIEVAGDVPDLWEPAGASTLLGLLERWDQEPAARLAIEEEIRAHLWRLSEDDVPALVPR